MNRIDFLKMSSLATLSVVGAWTGLSKTFAQSPSQSENEHPYGDSPSGSMEYRKLGGKSVNI